MGDLFLMAGRVQHRQIKEKKGRPLQLVFAWAGKKRKRSTANGCGRLYNIFFFLSLLSQAQKKNRIRDLFGPWWIVSVMDREVVFEWRRMVSFMVIVMWFSHCTAFYINCPFCIRAYRHVFLVMMTQTMEQCWTASALLKKVVRALQKSFCFASSLDSTTVQFEMNEPMDI